MRSNPRWRAVALLWCMACAGDAPPAPGDSSESPIIGGVPAPDLPAVVRLLDPPNFVCTGTLISPTWVLTAAHCESARAVEIEEIGQTLSIVEWKNHPGWDPEGDTVFDYAVARIARPVEGVEPMALDRSARLTAMTERLASPTHAAESPHRRREDFETCERCGGLRRSAPAALTASPEGFLVARLHRSKEARSLVVEALEANGSLRDIGIPALELDETLNVTLEQLALAASNEGELTLATAGFRETGEGPFGTPTYAWRVLSWRYRAGAWRAMPALEVEGPPRTGDLGLRYARAGELALSVAEGLGYSVYTASELDTWQQVHHATSGYLQDVLPDAAGDWQILAHGRESVDGGLGYGLELYPAEAGAAGISLSDALPGSVEGRAAGRWIDGSLIVASLHSADPCADPPRYRLEVGAVSELAARSPRWAGEVRLPNALDCTGPDELDVQIVELTPDRAVVAIIEGRRRSISRRLIRAAYRDGAIHRVTLDASGTRVRSVRGSDILTSSGPEPSVEALATDAEGRLAVLWVADEISMRSDTLSALSDRVERLYPTVWSAERIAPDAAPGETRLTVVGYGADREDEPTFWRRRPRAKAFLEPVGIDAGWVYLREREQAACFGDSGGPLLVDGPDGQPTVAAVASFVIAKRTAFGSRDCVGMAAYAKLAPVMDWLDASIDRRAECALECDCALGCALDGSCQPASCYDMSCGDTVRCENRCWELFFDDDDRRRCVQRCRSDSDATPEQREFLTCATEELEWMWAVGDATGALPERTLDQPSILRTCGNHARECFELSGCQVLDCLDDCETDDETCADRCDPSGLLNDSQGPLRQAMTCVEAAGCGALTGALDRGCAWERCRTDIEALGVCSGAYLETPPPEAPIAASTRQGRGGCAAQSPLLLLALLRRRRTSGCDVRASSASSPRDGMEH